MRFIRAQVGWLIATILALSLLRSLSCELFFVLSLLGLLIITGLTAPINVTPAWRERLKWLILAGMVVFVAIVIRRILEILPAEVLG